jgi:hypothetical protein
MSGNSGHLDFSLEVDDPARGAAFELTAAENSPWSFFGCELNPVR